MKEILNEKLKDEKENTEYINVKKPNDKIKTDHEEENERLKKENEKLKEELNKKEIENINKEYIAKWELR